MEEKCYQRFDERGDEVLLRLAGQQNEIMLANGRYHADYKTKFHLKTKDDDEKLKEIDSRFLKVAKEVSRDKKKICNSAELYKVYVDDNDNVNYYSRTFI